MGKKFQLITNYEIDPLKARLESVQEFLIDQIQIEEDINIHLHACLTRLQETIGHLDLYYKSIGLECDK